MKYLVIFLMLVGTVFLPFTTQYVLAHGVHCGIHDCPVGAYGLNDWDLYRVASESMFSISLIAYGLIVMLFWYYLRKRASVFTMLKRK